MKKTVNRLLSKFPLCTEASLAMMNRILLINEEHFYLNDTGNKQNNTVQHN